MALEKYRVLEKSKGGFVPQNELEIYEKSAIKTSFGLWPNDTIRCIIYDANQTPLPQADFGTVRYINQKDFPQYFTSRPGNTLSNTRNYSVDVKQLIKDAGYNIGLFTVELMFVNSRVGTEKKPNRLWIYEISPSRTEVRVIPFDYGNALWDGEPLTDVVDERYRAVMYDKEFREDIYEAIDPFLDKINYNEIRDLFINRVGLDFYKQIVSQYYVNDEDVFFKNVVDMITKFKKAVRYEFENKNSTISSPQFGETLRGRMPVEIDFRAVNFDKLVQTVEYHVPVVSLFPQPVINLNALTTSAPQPITTRRIPNLPQPPPSALTDQPLTPIDSGGVPKPFVPPSPTIGILVAPGGQPLTPTLVGTLSPENVVDVNTLTSVSS
jgi:hypothetical protein